MSTSSTRSAAPTAAVWGSEPAGDLLSWLGVGSRHLVEPRGPHEGGTPLGTLDGLVLLDLSKVPQGTIEGLRKGIV